MKKILILVLLLLSLCSCTNDSGKFIDDNDLEYYGLLEIKNYVPSNKFHTSKYVDNIYVYMQIDDNLDCINFNEKIYDLLKNNDSFTYLGYTLSDNTKTEGATLMVYQSNNILDYYHFKPLSYDSGKVYFSSCSFFYILDDSDILFEIHINAYSLPKYINGKKYNMSIYLTNYNEYILN